MTISDLKYCNRCAMPDTNEGMVFDENGICQACFSSEQKMHINWSDRRKTLEDLLASTKQKAADNNSHYDCILPISGGKDSTYQLHVLVNVYKLRVLAVTFSHNWYSKIGFYNLINCLEQFNVDHIQFTPSRSTVNLSAKKSLAAIGDACWHCHRVAEQVGAHVGDDGCRRHREGGGGASDRGAARGVARLRAHAQRCRDRQVRPALQRLPGGPPGVRLPCRGQGRRRGEHPPRPAAAHAQIPRLRTRRHHFAPVAECN